MKRLTLLPLLFAFSLTVVLNSSCNKDDDSTPANNFVLNGETFALAKGFIQNYGDNGNGSYDFDVTVTSSEINYSDANEEFSGMGEFIYLDLNTSLETGLVNGTYNFSSERNAFALVAGSVGRDYDLKDFTGEDYDIVGGSVDIEVNGNEVIIDFNLTISNNSSVTGRYQGTLRSID